MAHWNELQLSEVNYVKTVKSYNAYECVNGLIGIECEVCHIQ